MGLLPDPDSLASEMDSEISHLSPKNTPNIRSLRRIYSQKIKFASSEYVLRFARQLCFKHGHRWIAYEIIAGHRATFISLGANELVELGQGIDSWWTVDSFARTLSGPAWLNGQIADSLIHQWARSPDLWWRRAALVSTVALNLRSKGGKGDVRRTLAVCSLLVEDHEDMVAKAVSWSLRELVVHDPEVVRNFLDQNEHVLAALVKREVRNKLNTGRKTLKRAGKLLSPKKKSD
jgi:3-methyladenine DNA glycosylase AlkD